MADKCQQIEPPQERYVAVTFPEGVWKFLEGESEESGLLISDIVRRIIDDYVRAEKGNCG